MFGRDSLVRGMPETDINFERRGGRTGRQGVPSCSVSALGSGGGAKPWRASRCCSRQEVEAPDRAAGWSPSLSLPSEPLGASPWCARPPLPAPPPPTDTALCDRRPPPPTEPTPRCPRVPSAAPRWTALPARGRSAAWTKPSRGTGEAAGSVPGLPSDATDCRAPCRASAAQAAMRSAPRIRTTQHGREERVLRRTPGLRRHLRGGVAPAAHPAHHPESARTEDPPDTAMPFTPSACRQSRLPGGRPRRSPRPRSRSDPERPAAPKC